MAIETKFVTANNTWTEISNTSFTSITITTDTNFSTKASGHLYIGSTIPAANTNQYVQLSAVTMPLALNQLGSGDKVYIRSSSNTSNTSLRLIVG